MMHLYLHQYIPEHMIPDSSSALHWVPNMVGILHIYSWVRTLHAGSKASQLQPQGSCSRKGRAAGHVVIWESYIPA